MLNRHDTLIFDGDTFAPLDTHCRQRIVAKTRPICHPIVPIRTPSPGEMSSSSSGLDEEAAMYDPVSAVPDLSLTTSKKHYEFWDPGPQ